jgi:hypothetical protein
MSSPINSAINQNHVNLVSHQAYIPKDSYVNPYLQAHSLNVAKLILYTAPAAAPQTTTVPLHNEKGELTGASVSYDPTNLDSIFAAAEELFKSPSQTDKQEAQKVFYEFQQKMQFEIQRLAILHEAAMASIKAMRG